MPTLLILGVTFATAAAGRLLVASGMDWYGALRLPEWAPGGAFISAVWIGIYAATAASAILYFRRPESRRRAEVAALFLLNAGLHVLWSHLFFQRHLIGAALFEMALLWATVLMLIVRVFPDSRASAALLLPYAAWVPIAAALCWQTWRLNG